MTTILLLVATITATVLGVGQAVRSQGVELGLQGGQDDPAVGQEDE